MSPRLPRCSRWLAVERRIGASRSAPRQPADCAAAVARHRRAVEHCRREWLKRALRRLLQKHEQGLAEKGADQGGTAQIGCGKLAVLAERQAG